MVLYYTIAQPGALPLLNKHTSTQALASILAVFQSRMLDFVDSSLIHLASTCTLKMEGSLLLLLLLCAVLSSGPCLQMPTTLCSSHFVGDLKWCLSVHSPHPHTHTCTCTHIFQLISIKLASPFLGFALVSTPHQAHMHDLKIWFLSTSGIFYHNACSCQSQVFLLSDLEVWSKGT